MNGIYNRKSLILIMVFLIFNTPILPVDIGVSSIHLYLVFAVVIVLYTFTLEKQRADNLWVFIFLVFVLFFSLILILGRDENLIKFANQSIPQQWAELYGKKDYQDFYRSTKIALFQLLNFIMMLVFFNFSNKNKRNFDYELKNILILTLFIQFFIVLVQKFFWGEDRPTGTLGNSQSVGFLLSVIACYIFVYCSRLEKKLLFVIVVLTSLVTGTRSVIGVLSILWILDFGCFRLKYSRLIPFFVFTSTVLATMIISYFESIRDIILFGMNFVTSPLSMNVRFLMRSSISQVISESYKFGTYGIPTYFTDNAYWNFILPYGIFGGIFIVVFFGAMIKFANKNNILYYLSIVYSMQSISYSGAFYSNLAMGMFLLLGYEYSKLKCKK
jgi:hypothetical protein